MEITRSERIEAIAQEVIKARPELHFIDEMGLRIDYRESDQKKRKNGGLVHAECEKVKDKDKMYIPFDFLITVYVPNCMDMTEDQIKILIWHELLHVGADETDAGIKTRIIHHDIEDFQAITKKFGENWDADGADVDDICGGE